MEFFNKKEEVISLQLTQFGRHLMSKGKFKPIYYSFFDDNILYNSENAGFSELQNDSEDRIRLTQLCKPQINFSSLEKEFGNSYEMILSGKEKVGSVSLQRTPEKNYALTQPLGASDINSEYAPSWSVLFLNGHLSGAIAYQALTEKSGGTNNILTPQLDCHTEVKTIKVEDIEEDLMFENEFEEGPSLSNVTITSTEEDLFVLLKVSENNGFYQKKNYDIELYEILEEDQNGTIIETLRPLSFSLHHDPESELGFMDEVDPTENMTHSEYYLDIMVDDEIGDELLCKYDPIDETLGVFADPRTELCQDIINKKKKKVFNVYDEGIDDSPGDIC
tara:strand:- start:279 stop:1280 length:1002 start_codon:yes stop_codon:yes gene_type:complete